MSINGQTDVKVVLYIFNGTLLSHKEEEMLPFVTTWMAPEDMILSEISQTEKQILYDLIYM